MERAALICDRGRILTEDLVLPPPASLETLELSPGSSERERIIAALAACAGNQTRAAELLGMSRRTFVTRLDELDVPRPRKAKGGAATDLDSEGE
jgi:transcriptional regulator of acetoin/glycerol metabolism